MEPTATVLLNRLTSRGRLRHVQVLLKLAELGSVLRTADAIGMTQSSVTQTLAYLERLLEVDLFQRHARGMRPTAACLAVIPAARQMMQGVTQSAEQIATLHRAGEGTVRLIGSASALSGLLVHTLPAFTSRYPQMQVQLREAEGADQLMAIASSEVDLVVCRRPAVVPEGWVFRKLLDDRLAVLCASTHPLAGRLAGWKTLAASTWLLAPAGSLARVQFDHLLDKCFPTPPRLHPLITRSNILLLRLLQEPGVVGLLPLSLMRHLMRGDQLAEIRTRERMPLEPIGLLLPAAGAGRGTVRLAEYLGDAAHGSTDSHRAE
ncbi:DNA-binding transcriptional regulator, LysR family [Variovorax sp. HW608]|uniref:LysR family transcriptional regulator n=1 Tax=Variovorax sp. HW608 TaxID=1034889 RepID=UPI00081F82DD|nr:LysR family transcriptional regulator [Variovorax sp. HW608]SCK09869.1 DNA-binding transcriptional regulator, LysR family [Variovorax sp. HW608]